jgi:uncharacterized membrane protein required for colicin V production
MRITFFDVLFLLGMIGGAAMGFYRGLFRSAIGTIVIYVSTVVSTIGYRSLGRLFSGATGQGASASDVLAFVILMAVLNILLRLMTKELTAGIDHERMGIWVNLSGMVFGFVNAAVWCAVLLMIMRSATGGDPWLGYQGVQKFFQEQTHNSWMAYVFRPFMRFLLAIIKPWLFGHELPPLLVNAL